jgi:hypothetical protein
MVKKAKKPAKAGAANVSAFTATGGGSISQDEIYHRLEWYFDHSHDPQRGHTIDPNTPIDSFFQGVDPARGRQVLWVNINKISPTYIPAWRSALFHGVDFPWPSHSEITIGIRDIQSFGNLIDAAVRNYTQSGWNVT